MPKSHPISDTSADIELKVEKMAIIENATKSQISESIAAAAEASKLWSSELASKRGEGLFHLSETLSARSQELVNRLIELGANPDDARKEVDVCVERTFWYAGWADKLSQVYSSNNAVAAPFVSQTLVEPAGLVAIFGRLGASLLEFVSMLMPVLAAGNAAVVMLHSSPALSAISLFLDIIATTPLPARLVVVLQSDSLDDVSLLAGDARVSVISCHGESEELRKTIRDASYKTLKHMELFSYRGERRLLTQKGQSPSTMIPFIEFKTVWHPVAPLTEEGATY